MSSSPKFKVGDLVEYYDYSGKGLWGVGLITKVWPEKYYRNYDDVGIFQYDVKWIASNLRYCSTLNIGWIEEVLKKASKTKK